MTNIFQKIHSDKMWTKTANTSTIHTVYDECNADGLVSDLNRYSSKQCTNNFAVRNDKNRSLNIFITGR